MARLYRKRPLRLVGMGPRIRACRLKHGFTQRALAERLQCTETTVYLLERDGVRDARASLMLDCARVLGVTVDWLLSGDAGEAIGAACGLDASRDVQS